VFVLVLPGLIARALYPDINGDDAYPTMVVKLLPTGLVGFMVAALMAALMSSLAAAFNSASTLVTFDVFKVLRPAATEKQLVQVGRIVTVVMVGLSMLWVPFIKYLSAEVYIYLQSVQAYISPPIAVCFIFGILWPRLNGAGAIWSLLVGFVLGSLRFVLEVLDKTRHYDSPAIRWLVDMNFLHYAILMFAVCAAVLIAVSLATKAPDRRTLAGLTFATVDDKIETAPVAPVHALARETGLEHRLNVLFSGALLATVIGLWIYFR
jgi:SSS family solute:Na+ symporter